MRTLGALDPRLLANAADPFVRAGRSISRLACLSALEATRVDILATAEQRSEQRNLRL